MPNWELLKNPLNYAIVGSMAFVALFVVNLLLPPPPSA